MCFVSFFLPAFSSVGTNLMKLMKIQKEIGCLTGVYSFSVQEYTTQSSGGSYILQRWTANNAK